MSIVYILNIIVAGWISLVSMTSPSLASRTIFSGAYQTNELMRLVGCLWLGIAVLSACGLWRPITFSPVLLIQLIYKGSWLAIVALPALLHGKPFPASMALFFMAWVLVLPFVIPWRELFGD